MLNKPIEQRTAAKAVYADIPVCLCQQVMRRKADPPRLLRSQARDEYLMYCPTCGFRTHPDWNKQAVISEWYGANKTGDQHIESLWIERYEQQQESLAVQRSNSCNSGTTAPQSEGS